MQMTKQQRAWLPPKQTFNCFIHPLTFRTYTALLTNNNQAAEDQLHMHVVATGSFNVNTNAEHTLHRVCNDMVYSVTNVISLLTRQLETVISGMAHQVAWHSSSFHLV